MIRTAIIVDDEQAGCDNLERLLGYCDGVEVVATTKVPEKAVELITEMQPDILF